MLKSQNTNNSQIIDGSLLHIYDDSLPLSWKLSRALARAVSVESMLPRQSSNSSTKSEPSRRAVSEHAEY
jgi:hypothetical protein